MEKLRLSDGREVPENKTYSCNLVEAVADVPFYAFNHFFEMMKKVADHEEEYYTLERLELAESLYKQAISTTEKILDKLQSKAGKIRITFSTAGRDVVPEYTPLDVQIIPTDGSNGTAKKEDEIPGDFRTVQPGTEEEAQLQCLYKLMQAGPKQRSKVRDLINFVRKEA